MKLIAALKGIKELTAKAADLRTKIQNHSAHLSIETPVYADQKEQVSKWLQAHEDVVREVSALSVRVAKTNLATTVPIKIGDHILTKSITEWVIRRRTLAAFDAAAWSSLTDRGLKEQTLGSTTPGGTPTPIKIVRCYDPELRDKKIELYRGEPNAIDVALEIVNATTDLLD